MLMIFNFNVTHVAVQKLAQSVAISLINRVEWIVITAESVIAAATLARLE